MDDFWNMLREFARNMPDVKDLLDLQAQQQMAVWAERMFWATLGSLVVTAFGALLLWRTLVHTKSAAIAAMAGVREARLATVAAEQAGKVTQTIGEAQTRAYLYCKSASYKLTRDAFTAVVEIGNSGQSPASDIKIAGTLDLHEVAGRPSMPRVIGWLNSEDIETYAPPVVAGGSVVEEFTVFDFQFRLHEHQDEDSRTAMIASANELWFELVIGWRDVFGERHDFHTFLSAVIGPHPHSRKKRRANAGSLTVRMNDTRHHVVGPEVVGPEDV